MSPASAGGRPQPSVSAKLVERYLDDVRWLSVSGGRDGVFRALGEHMKSEIVEVIDELVERRGLRSWVSRPKGEDRLAALCEASASEYPRGWAELEALATGAAVEVDDLALLTLRGDVGDTDEASGCSELAWMTGHKAVLGHNEDGDPVLAGRSVLLTLHVDGEVAATTWWYAGFLPGNTFTLTEDGLVWGIDAIRVAAPPVGPGRGFVARGLQGVRSLDDAIAYLQTHESAGGFSYTFGELGSGRVVVVEHAAGESAIRETAGSDSYLWHTNHLRFLPNRIGRASKNSLERGETLGGLSAPESAGADRVLALLSQPPPSGVRADGDSITLCTAVTHTGDETITLVPHDGRKTVVPVGLLFDGGGRSDRMRTEISALHYDSD